MPIQIPDTLATLGNQYPLAEDTSIQGGFCSVLNTTNRDAIPASSRKAGMLVWTQTETTMWQLQADLVSWALAPLGKATMWKGALTSNASWGVGGTYDITGHTIVVVTSLDAQRDITVNTDLAVEGDVVEFTNQDLTYPLVIKNTVPSTLVTLPPAIGAVASLRFNGTAWELVGLTSQTRVYDDGVLTGQTNQINITSPLHATYNAGTGLTDVSVTVPEGTHVYDDGTLIDQAPEVNFTSPLHAAYNVGTSKIDVSYTNPDPAPRDLVYVATMSADKTAGLAGSYDIVGYRKLNLTPSGAHRTVSLKNDSALAGDVIEVTNPSTSYNLVVANSGGTTLFTLLPNSAPAMFRYTGANWELYWSGDPAPRNLTCYGTISANSTAGLSGAYDLVGYRKFVLSPTGADRTLTLKNDSAVIGDVIEVYNNGSSGYLLTVCNSGGTTLKAIPPSCVFSSKFRYNGTNWVLLDERAEGYAILKYGPTTINAGAGWTSIMTLKGPPEGETWTYIVRYTRKDVGSSDLPRTDSAPIHITCNSSVTSILNCNRIGDSQYLSASVSGANVSLSVVGAQTSPNITWTVEAQRIESIMSPYDGSQWSTGPTYLGTGSSWVTLQSVKDLTRVGQVEIAYSVRGRVYYSSAWSFFRCRGIAVVTYNGSTITIAEDARTFDSSSVRLYVSGTSVLLQALQDASKNWGVEADLSVLRSQEY